MSSEEMRRLGVEVVRAVRERFPKGALDHPRYPRRNPARKLSAAMDFAIEYERALRRANHTLARLSPETATYLFEQLAAAYVSGPTGVVTRDSMAFTVLAEIVRRATKPMRVGITEYDDSRRGTHPFVFMYAPGAGEPWVVDAWAQCPSVAPLSQTQFAKRGCGRMLTMETRTPLRLFGVPRDFSKNEPGLDVYAHYLDERSQQPLQELPYQPVRPCPEDFSILTRWPSRYQVPIGSDPYTDVAPDSWLVGPLALIVTLFLIFRVGRVPNRVGRVPNRRLRFYARILAGAM
ncbi:MAG: hypothetical protein AAF355_11285 [Myxococcota bacterium]